jgi:NO-binding membrane sensor protein with MHYT domain
MSYADIDLPVDSDFRLIALSVIISLIGSYTALDIAEQSVFNQQSLPQRPWILGGDLTLGMTIWAMHFTAILAHSLPISISYDFGIVLLSMAVSILGLIAGLWMVSRLTLVGWAIGGICVGMSIIAMHYIGGIPTNGCHPGLSSLGRSVLWRHRDRGCSDFPLAVVSH